MNVNRLSLWPGVLGLMLGLVSSVHANPIIYQQLLPSTAWIITPVSWDKANTGSGVLVDLEKKWLVTNYHVVDEHREVMVHFPYRIDGKVKNTPNFYMKMTPDIGIKGLVVWRDSKRDLALIALEKLPAEAQPVVLAAQSALPGETVHSIGNPANSPALWAYTSGTVRQTVEDKWEPFGNGRRYYFMCKVLLTQAAVNPGDSGGPVVNDRGELIGLVSTTGPGQLNNKCIDIEEIKSFLARAPRDLGYPAPLIERLNRARPEPPPRHNPQTQPMPQVPGSDTMPPLVPQPF